MNRPFYSIVGALSPELSPKEATIVQKALFLQGPPVAVVPGTTAPDPLSLRYQHGWVDGANAGLSRGVLVGALAGALTAWLVLRK
jgi:hypothetical protein